VLCGVGLPCLDVSGACLFLEREREKICVYIKAPYYTRARAHIEGVDSIYHDDCIGIVLAYFWCGSSGIVVLFGVLRQYFFSPKYGPNGVKKGNSEKSHYFGVDKYCLLCYLVFTHNGERMFYHVWLDVDKGSDQ
jgi:hypothetical protein